MRQLVATQLSRVWGMWRRAWRLVTHDLGSFGILRTGPDVRVLDSEQSAWRFRDPQTLVPWQGRGARFRAHLLPPDMVLQSRLRIPLQELDFARAAQWEVRAISPFPADETLWTWREQFAESDPTWRHAEVFLTHRRKAAAWLEEREVAGVAGPGDELWAAPGVPFPGFGEARRLRAQRRSRRGAGMLLISLFVLLVALLVWPVWESRAMVVEANRTAASLERQAAPAVEHRERLIQGVEQAGQVRPFLRDTPDPARTLAMLTRAFPDGAFLDHMNQQGREVEIRGVAEAAARLIDDIEALEQVTELRSTAPIARDPRTQRERFQLRFQLRVPEDAS